MTRRTKLATPTYYWGEGGQYGPFDVQQDGDWAGWPDFGQVLRYFRKKAGITTQAFCILYGNEVNGDGCAVSERWILKMELNNKVPVDMKKRRTLARLFEIPPMLFGLAILEDFTVEPRPQVIKTTGQTKLAKAAIDTTRYQNNRLTIWQLHETSNAQNALTQLSTDIQDLESLEQQTQGDLLLHIQELLFSDQILATHIVRDQRQFHQAYYHSNEAVRVAKSMKDNDLIATALFTRGWTRFEWGMFGTLVQNMFQVECRKIEEAISDFEKAKTAAPAVHPQLLALIAVFWSRAQVVLSVEQKKKVSTAALTEVDNVADFVGRESIDDPSTCVLVTGTRTGFLMGGYLDNRAAVFNAAGLPALAMQELNALEGIMDVTYKRDYTRQHAYLDILRSKSLIGLQNYSEAAQRAKRALASSKDINSVTNTAIITDIYGRLRISPYKASADVRELGDLLKE